MCLPLIALAGAGIAAASATTVAGVATAAVSAAGTIASTVAASSKASQDQKNANNAASQANAASLAQSQTTLANDEATWAYQDDNWQSDLDYATSTLKYDQTEFGKQATYVQAAGTAIVQNEDASLAQTMLRSVQQDISQTFGETNANAQAAKARSTAQVAADTRGASGNTVNSIIQDVSRQQGDVISVMEMNRDAQHQQARVDLMNVQATADSQLGALQASVKTYAPSTPIRAPAPTGAMQAPQVTTAADVSSAQTSPFAIAGGVLQAGVGAFNTYDQVTHQDAKQTIGQIGDYLGIK